MNDLNFAYYKSEIGLIKISGSRNGIYSVDFIDEEDIETSPPCPSLDECARQLDEYFKGQRKEFQLDLSIRGTAFQETVWRELINIPYGHTLTYKEMAARIGHANAVRAVGNTNRLNKIAIIIPCHRVIGSNGKLTGYAGGIWRKKWLLDHERGISRIKI